MEKKTASAIMLTLLLTSMLTLAFNIQPAKASETIIDTHGDSRFTKYPSGPYWWSVSDHDAFHTRAYNNNFWYTYCGDAAHGGDLYFGMWTPSVIGEYEVFVWIPNPDPFGTYTPTHSANYQIWHSSGLTERVVNQALRLGGWYSLGSFTFDASSSIILNDRTGEPYTSTMIAFDAIKFTQVVPPRTLTVSSAHDSPNPSNGAHSYSNGQWVTCSVTSPADQSGGTRYRCTGYSGTGSCPSDTGTSVTFAITQDSTIVWNWAAQYSLTVASAHDSPSPSVGTWWYDSGASLTCSVTSPAEGYSCTGWTGTGSVPSSGSATSTSPFIINQGSAITWNWIVPPPVPRTLTVYSSPSGVSFTANGTSHTTPWSGTYNNGDSVSLVMPSTYSAGDPRYYWDRWSDGTTSSSRTITLNSDTTLTGSYIGPYYELIIASTPVSGVPFTLNGASKTTTYSEWLYQGYYTIEMPTTHSGYVWQSWLEDGSTSRTRTVLLNTAVSLTAIYVIPSVPDFSIMASPTYLIIQRGSSGSSTITITSINGFNQPVQLGVSGAPSGVTATPSPSQVTPPAGGTATSTLTISVDATTFAPPDTCAVLIVTGTSGTLTYSTSISLEIPPLQKVLERPLVNPFPPNPSPYVRATVSYHPIDDATYEVLEVTFSSQGVNKGWIEFGIVDHDKYIASVSPVPTDKWYTFFHTSGEEKVFPLSIIVQRNDIMALGFAGVASGSVYFGTDILVTLARLSGDLIRNAWPVTTTFEPETSVFEVTSRVMPFELASLGSPGELRVYDSEGRTTGFVDGQPTEEILCSMIIDEVVVVFLPSDLYKYEVAGTADGSYDLAVGSVENGSSTFFIATDIPTLAGANHQYTINWDALSAGEEGVTVEVDSDGNGVPEYTFTSDSELTRNEFLIQTGQSALYTFSIFWGAETFTVSVESNSTVSNFAFSPGTKSLSFTVNGTSGTGFCNVTIPKALLHAAPSDWIVLIDGVPLPPIAVTLTENATHSCLYFTYAHSTHTIQILGTWVIGPPPPPLSVSITPLSASILLGQSVTFTSTVSGGYTPYGYQWYLNGAPVSGATSASWIFTPTTSGIYYIHLKATDAKANTAQSDTARITFPPPPPVGGYSVAIGPQTKAEPVLPYIALIAILTAIFTKLKPKTKRKR